MKNDYISEIYEKDKLVLHPYENFNDRGTYNRKLITKSDNIYLYDENGNKFIDGPGGMWCNNIGHGNREIGEAIKDQIDKMDYCSPFSESTEVSAELASVLADLSPGDLNTVFFTSDGSTANETALRFVMFYNNILGKPFLVKEFEDKIRELGSENVAAFIAEPVLASGGCIVPPEGYYKKIYDVCKKNEIIFIADEVVTGFGRLGHFFSSEEVFGVVPDIITCAKGITSGYLPLGAVLFSDKLIGDLKHDSSLFFHGYTYSGHPACCAAALKNIEILKRDKILEHVREIEPYFFEKLNTLYELPIVGDIRGKGLMAGIECVINKNSKEALILDKAIGSRIDEESIKLGLIIRPLYHICVLSPALIITKNQIDDLTEKLYLAISNTIDQLQKEGLWSSQK